MTPTLLLFVGMLLLVFAILGLFLGRRLERSQGAGALAEALKEPEAARQALAQALALAQQAEVHLREAKGQVDREFVDLKGAHEELAERYRIQGGALQAAQTQATERADQLKVAQGERDDLRRQLTQAEAGLRAQGEKLGEASGLKTNLEEVQGTLKTREEEITRLQKDLNEAEIQIAALKTAAQKDQEALTAEREQLEGSRQVFRQEFENLANQIFEGKQQTFEVRSKEGLTSLLAPFKEQLDTFRLRVDQVHTENVQGHTSLKGELDRLRELNQQITEEASNLTRALKGDKKIQGNWGEQKVELLLEQSGLRKGIEFSREQNFKDDEGNNLRPDFVVNLPEGKHLIIDSKVSLNDYAAYIASESPEERQQYLAAHIAAIRNHIRSLSDKKYPELLNMESPDFTFLFIAIEPAYLAAAEHCPPLFQEAYEKRIVLVTATTLWPVLRVIANLWTIQRQNQFTKELAEQASKVYDKLRIFIEKMQKLGNQIDTVQKTYKDSFDTLKDGKGSLVRTVERFELLGVKVIKRLPSSVATNTRPEIGMDDEPADPEEILEVEPLA